MSDTTQDTGSAVAEAFAEGAKTATEVAVKEEQGHVDGRTREEIDFQHALTGAIKATADEWATTHGFTNQQLVDLTADWAEKAAITFGLARVGMLGLLDAELRAIEAAEGGDAG